jgi:hypothetical protein
MVKSTYVIFRNKGVVMGHKFFYVLFVSVIISGCASDPVRLYVNTQPQGAALSTHSGSAMLGVSPSVFSYPQALLKQHRDAQGCYLLTGFTARWPSGAKSSTEPVVRICGNSDAYNITISRDLNAPGIEADLDAANRAASVAAPQRQAEAAEAAALIGVLGVTNNTAPKTTSCNTYAIGKTLQTNCR